MNTIQQSAALKNMLTLIEKTYEKVDFLWETEIYGVSFAEDNLGQHSVLM